MGGYVNTHEPAKEWLRPLARSKLAPLARMAQLLALCTRRVRVLTTNSVSDGKNDRISWGRRERVLY